MVRYAVHTGLFSTLKPQQREVLTSRYIGDDRNTLQNVGDAMSLSKARIGQIEAGALREIKSLLQSYSTGQEMKEPSLEDITDGIGQLNLLPRTYNTLQRSRYASLTPDEIREISDDELLAIRGFGRASLRNLRTQLGQYQEEPVESLLPIRERPEKSTINRELIEQMCNEIEWNRQTNNYLTLGFHTELGMTAQDYLNSLPKFGSMPRVHIDNYLGFYDSLLVETRIPVRRQFELAGISYTTEEIVEGAFDYPYKSPSKPYTVWTQSAPYEIPFVDHSRDNPKSVEEVRQQIRHSGEYRGATLVEGAAFIINYGVKIRSQFLDLPGVLMTERGTNTEVAPFLSERSDGSPILHYRPINQRKYDWAGHDPVKIFGRDPDFGALLVAA